MKKTKTKVKPSVRPPEKSSKETAKRTTKGQVVKLGAKKKRAFKFPPLPEYLRQARQFLSEAWIELKKVTWPGRKETLGATVVVIVLVILLSGFLGLVDMLLSWSVKNFVR